MKITYTPNPLDTIVELDAHEQRDLWHKIRFEQMVDRLFSVHYQLTYKKDNIDMEELRRASDPDFYLNDDEGTPDVTRLDKRCDELLEHYLSELKSNHVGDCTCVACSCSKCHAEGLVGADTLKPYPGKHQLSKIAAAFSRWNPETKQHDGPEVSLDEAIEKLANYDPQPSGDQSAWDKVGGFMTHVPRWKAEAKSAHEYLVNYRNTHFPKE